MKRVLIWLGIMVAAWLVVAFLLWCIWLLLVQVADRLDGGR